MATKQLEILVKARNEASGALNSVAKDVENVGKKGESGLKGFLGSLKGDFGRSSSLFQLGKIFAGGGAIIGLKLITQELAHAAQAARGLADEMRDGNLSTGEMADHILRAIPLLGNIYAAGRDIREIFTGEEYAAKQVAENCKLIDAAIEASKKSALDFDDAIKRIHKTSQELGKELAEAQAKGLPGPFRGLTEGFVGASSKFDSDKDRIEQEAKASIDKLKKDTEASRAALKTKIDAIAIPDATISVPNENPEDVGNAVLTQDNSEARNKAIADRSALERELKQLDTQLADETKKINEKSAGNFSTALRLLFTNNTNTVRDFWKEVSSGGEQAWAKIKARFKELNQHHDEVDKSLAHAESEDRLRVLDAEAARGNVAAEVEAKRLRLAEEFADKKRELLKIANDETATIGERQKARQLLGLLPGQERSAAGDILPSHSSVTLASLEDSRFLTGVRQQSEAQENIVAKLVQGNKTAEQMNNYLKDINDNIFSWLFGGNQGEPVS